MIKTTFLLKKDLPTIKAGRIIELSTDGKYGYPRLMSVEKNSSVGYLFPINVLKSEKEWFELLEDDTTNLFEEFKCEE